MTRDELLYTLYMIAMIFALSGVAPATAAVTYHAGRLVLRVTKRLGRIGRVNLER